MMKAWQLDRPGGRLDLIDRPLPEVRAGSVLVRMETSLLMSYLQAYVEGQLSVYQAPDRPFTPGGNGVGIVEAVGRDVWHLRTGQRVVISSHVVAQENAREPAQFLLGVTAMGREAVRMQSDWPDGTLAEYALVPATVLTPVPDDMPGDPAALASAMRFLVPYGGLLRGRLQAGETLIVSGATGAYGAAATMLGLAMGAARVVAVGRNAHSLAAVARAGGARVVPVQASGDVAADAAQIREASGGGAHLAFDMVGNATDPAMTLAALRGLRREGRLVLMGSMSVPVPLPYLEVMFNGWEIIGNFMYPRNAPLRLFELIRSGQLDLRVVHAKAWPLADLHDAMRAAAEAGCLECVVMRH